MKVTARQGKGQEGRREGGGSRGERGERGGKVGIRRLKEAREW